MLLQAFYSIRSERLLMERLEYDLLFRWFVGIGVDDAAWDHSVFSKNRDRLLEGDIAAKFLAAMLAQPKVKKLLSSDHFSVDGTLIEAWASMKSVKPKDGSGEPPAQDWGKVKRPEDSDGLLLRRTAPNPSHGDRLPHGIRLLHEQQAAYSPDPSGSLLHALALHGRSRRYDPFPRGIDDRLRHARTLHAGRCFPDEDERRRRELV
jgi:hypothetical protein